MAGGVLVPLRLSLRGWRGVQQRSPDRAANSSRQHGASGKFGNAGVLNGRGLKFVKTSHGRPDRRFDGHCYCDAPSPTAPNPPDMHMAPGGQIGRITHAATAVRGLILNRLTARLNRGEHHEHRKRRKRHRRHRRGEWLTPRRLNDRSAQHARGSSHRPGIGRGLATRPIPPPRTAPHPPSHPDHRRELYRAPGKRIADNESIARSAPCAPQKRGGAGRVRNQGKPGGWGGAWLLPTRNRNKSLLWPPQRPGRSRVGQGRGRATWSLRVLSPKKTEPWGLSPSAAPAGIREVRGPAPPGSQPPPSTAAHVPAGRAKQRC